MLKCNAHLALEIGLAMDKLFRDVESQVGKEKLILAGVSHCLEYISSQVPFGSPSNSVWYLGLLAKALFPSHCTESNSLFMQYTKLLRKDMTANTETSELSADLIRNGFKGFSSNRFRRIGELYRLLKIHINTIQIFQ